MRALVTGACGFVGRHLVSHLKRSGDEVLGTRFGPDPSVVPFNSVQLEITDRGRCAEIIKDFQPEVIYHLAGIAFVPEAEDNFRRALLVNVDGTNTLYSVCRMLEIPVKILLVSSAEVYGRILNEELPIREGTPIRPANNYSLSKAMAELIPRRHVDTKALSSIVMRPFNHIGPGQNDRFVASSFARQLAAISAGKSEPVISVGNLEARRDFCDVRDVVRAYRMAAEKGTGVYNTAGVCISIQELLDMLLEISGLDVEVRQDPSRMRPSEVPIIQGSYAKIEQELGWKPEIDIRQTLSDIYGEWLKIEKSQSS
jgi:GDP-4-dehydro-6-deoxy-D-mannose reductase